MGANMRTYLLEKSRYRIMYFILHTFSTVGFHRAIFYVVNF